MDLESYIGRYQGGTRLQRLLLIARTTPDDTLAAQAFNLAEQQMRGDGNVKKYKEVFGYQHKSQAQSQAQAQQNKPQSAGGQEISIFGGAPQQAPLEEASSQSQSQQALFRHPKNIHFDQQWVLATEASNQTARLVLQGRLSAAQSHLHKEAIRTAYIALSQHDGKTGDLRLALSSLLRATDYCTTRSQTAQISLLILEWSFCMEHYEQVRAYVTKVEHTLGGSASASTPTAAGTAASSSSPTNSAAANAALLQEVSIKLKIASGLERMAQGHYADAATIFTKLLIMSIPTSSMASMSMNSNSNSATSSPPRHKLDWPGVTCPEDIALYASLLSLATAPVRSCILELAEHPEALELVPAMKDLLLQWSRANYVKCMQAFAHVDADSGSLLVPAGDLYLMAPTKVTTATQQGNNNIITLRCCGQVLSQQIREKCLMEYLRPYQCVRLDSMSQLFPSISNLQDTLVDLMGRGLIPNAKIDARANVLYKTMSATKATSSSLVSDVTIRNISAMERRVLDDTHAMVIRLGCMENDLIVQDVSATSRGGGGGGARRGAAAAAAAARYDNDESTDEEGDTPMLDADSHNNAANPEDLY